MNKPSAAEHIAQLQHYFNGIGFERWSAIYGKAPLSRIRQTVREGHQQMLAQAQSWLLETHSSGTLLDAGCGTGLFSVAMAQQGFTVTSLDVAPRMVEAAQSAAQQAGVTLNCITGDASSVNGTFDVVACFDVLVHYPKESFVPLCKNLAERSSDTLLLTYAPYNRFLAFLHRIGGFFPRQNRRTEIQMIPDEVVSAALQEAGMVIKRTVSISHGFYHVKLLQAVRKH